MSNIRKAEKAGTWYPANPEQLRSILDDFLSSAPSLLKDPPAPPFSAVITPHAGLLYSGECAATGFHLLSTNPQKPETIIIFAATHTSYLTKPGIYSSGSWETPLGNLKVDEELAALLLETPFAEDNPECHRSDNAIELQTPFIKHLFPESNILPVAVPVHQTGIELGKKLADISRHHPGKYLVIGSTDLTHYGLAYGFAPAGTGKKGNNWARENDIRLLNLICEMRVEEIIPEVTENHNACGAGAIAATMSYCRRLNITEGHVLNHVLSTDIINDGNYDLSVGYGSIIF